MTILDEVGVSIRQMAEGAGTSVVGIGQRWGAGSGIVLGEGQILTNARPTMVPWMAVATPINTARRHQSRAERAFRPHARPEVAHAQQLNWSTASTRVPAYVRQEREPFGWLGLSIKNARRVRDCPILV